MTPAATPPVADQRPHSATWHGVTIADPFFWLKDPGYPVVSDPDILAYVTAENDWFEAHMAPLAGLTATIFEELKGRVKPDDASVPVKDGDYEYWWAFAAGAQYRQWWRRPVAGGAPALILDEVALADGHAYFRLGGLAVSPDGRRLAYAVDTAGDERFVLKVRDLASGADIATVTDRSVGSPVWTADSHGLAWTEVNDQWRRFRVRLHRLGSEAEDATLYEEVLDIGFGVGVGRSQDGAWFVIATSDHVTSEIRLVPTDAPETPPLLVRARQPGVQYEVDVRGDSLVIRANDTHPNFRLATARIAAPGDWHELVAASDRDYLRGASAFTSFIAVTGRRDGLDQIRLLWNDGRDEAIAFPETAFAASLGSNPEPDAPLLRLSYTSMVTPATVYDYDTATGTLVTRKVQEVPSGYDVGLYTTERLTVIARDGAQIPVSLVHRRDWPRDGSGKLHLYGYGAYGIAIPPAFSSSRLSLLDRGVAYAIAHIRGGDDLGYQWYLDGKLEKRTNAFNDFVDVARGLIDQGLAREGRISASGGSAGGELMGAVINSDPGLWRAVVADVPFVDVLNTMLDDTLPLTPGEWPEWGNPITDKAAFDLIRSYSPYDNVRPQAYPALLVTAGLNDPRVTYWEPAKWVARLRATGTGSNPLLLKTNMGAGHGGKSGRFSALEETAEEYAFILQQFGLAGDAAAG
ncbi:S9 family peptidase [Polymorphobacter fuscus]|uniref:Prolyl oligopeptidase family serine peptidase n=1 Tax=Sandarakinorhabdus fusca TaxID=1439888 RepID=A0A7C9KXR0_9SPHN|nr:S9 family peptidase [Polymorphobacter fuscus]KAB7646460.1 S9 family peptidase [Polymorphobacter fuscus]MQT17702.1 prolyl oligopeptidase family serine peptidase [Polymorphobacter fuscus]NJC09751.1 oligopeptidase B [Polymorphobacter fuscus]